jgi:hypothetical protein
MNKKNLISIATFVESDKMSKSNVDLMLGSIRGGADGSSGGYSSSYTSGTRDCDGTSICKYCPPKK